MILATQLLHIAIGLRWNLQEKIVSDEVASPVDFEAKDLSSTIMDVCHNCRIFSHRILF